MSMGNIHLVTGYAGKEHVSSADMASLHSAIFGSEQFVLNRGNNLYASVVTNNQIKVLDGDILMKGRHIRLNPGSYVELAIENGTQGYMRNDLIVARYARDSVTGVEDCNLVVIKGTNATSNPTDPAYTSGDITFGTDLINDMPLYRVPLNGLNVGELVPLFTVVDAINPKALDHIGSKANPHNVTKSQIGLGSVPNVSTNNQTPTYTVASTLANIVSGEKLSVAFGKIAKFISVFTSHASRHKKGGEDPISAADIGAVPITGTPSDTPMTGDLRIEKDSPAIRSKNTAKDNGTGFVLQQYLKQTMLRNCSVANDLANYRAIVINGATGSYPTAKDLLWLAECVNGSITYHKVAHNGNFPDLGVAQIAAGTYVGTDTYGKDNPNTLNFSFVPKVILFFGEMRTANNGTDALPLVMLCDAGEYQLAGSIYGMTVGNVSVSGTKVSWYTTKSDIAAEDKAYAPYGQMNGKDKTYHYVAIG